jgi:acyl-CoA synthetase (AMP-forming)/AMP-acid ligase II
MPVISRLLSHHARYRADFPALDFEGRSWNYAEFNSEVNRLANALLAAGLGKGDRFATVLPNSLELMAAYWAAAVSGLVIVPCSVLLQPGGLRTLLGDASARLVICSANQVDNLAAIRDDLPDLLDHGYILVDGDAAEGFVPHAEFVAGAVDDDPGVLVEPDDVYNIMYSSGTTGLPKGIIHTHRIRSMYCTLFANAWRMSPESVCLHAGAIVFNGAMLDLMPWMFLGCRYVMHRSFDPEAVIADIERYRVTHVVMVPAQIIAILNSPEYSPGRLDSLQMIHNVGAPLHLRYKQIINEQLPDRFYELYGVTEGFMTVLDRTESVRKAGSVGKPAFFNEISILDETGNPLPAGEVGEICGTGPMVMPGYHNRPDLTEKAFHGRWLRSGDLGYMDDDGYLFLVDRAKDMIISGGVNVYPRDIEEVVIRHPAVSEVAVFGVEDSKWGEVPVAAVTVSGKLRPDELVTWVNQRVDARFQRIADAVVMEEFPRNVAGKILKRELREQYHPADR